MRLVTTEAGSVRTAEQRWMEGKMIKAVPIDFKECCAFIDALHRHHSAPARDKFRVGAEIDGVLHGVVSVGRPIARRLDDGKTLEVLRCCTDGTKNVCSFLYSRAARIAREMGYHKIITYILESESGDSLISAGWHCEVENVGGKSWDCPSRQRDICEQLSFLNERETKYPTCKKKRYAKDL